MDEATAIATGIWFRLVRASEDGRSCSFYPELKDLSEWLIVSRDLLICGWCVSACQDVVRERELGNGGDAPSWSVAPHLKERTCGFCGRPPADVGTMMAHSIGSICDKCVAVCASLIAQADARGEGAQ